MSAAVSLVHEDPPTDHQVRLAEALALLVVAEALHAERMDQSIAAEGRLVEATQAAVDALDALEASGETLLEASRLVCALRDAG